MKTESIKEKLGGLLKNKYALIVLGVGLLILLLPTGGKTETTAEKELTAPVFSLETEEGRLQRQLGKIHKAGKVSLLLSIEGSAARTLAESGEETLVVSQKNGEQVVELYYVNPTYMGAVVVCQGAGDPEVRLEITRAVSAFTGLGADKIRVIQMQQ